MVEIDQVTMQGVQQKGLIYVMCIGQYIIGSYGKHNGYGSHYISLEQFTLHHIRSTCEERDMS